MGRKIPLTENPTIHPILSLSLLITCIAATIAIVSSMCGFFSRKKSSLSQQKDSEDNVSQPPNEAIATISPTKEIDTSNMSQEIEKPLPLPPPPAASSYTPHSRASSFHFRSNSNVSLGKLTSTMSMKVQGGIKAIRQSSRRELDFVKKKEKNLKHEDSLWKKQIILGEKCRVPNENEEEDDTIIYDENGHKITAYHKKPPGPAGSLTMSRQSSEIDTNAIPS